MEQITQTKNVKKVFIILLLIILSIPSIAKAQSITLVSEISWNVYSQNYTGLLVLNQNNRGILRIKTYINGTGWVWIQEDAVLTNQYDIYGNCTSYINCYNPKTIPYVPWAADNFVIYPNGTMYTQDASGTWSTMIAAYIVPEYNWQAKFNEYGIE